MGLKIQRDGVNELIQGYHIVSITGLKVEMLDLEVQHVCTFVPTLSSLYFMTRSQNNRSKIIEFHEDQPPFKRKPLSLALKDALRPLENQSESLSSVINS